MLDQMFDSAGPENAPVLLLVHGSVVTRKFWLPQLRGLSTVYRVIAPDLPGHGKLAHLPFTFDTAVQALSSLIQQEAKGCALVAGVSLGGYIAIELAHQHPDQVAGLVLSGCTVNFTGILGLYIRLVSGMMQRGWLKQSHAQAEEKTRRMFPPSLADVADAQLQAGVYPENLGPSFKEMAGKDFAARLSAYPGPVLILNGENDSASRKNEGMFAARLKNGRVQHVPGASHACNLDNPVAYNQAVRAFGQAVGWIAAKQPDAASLSMM